MVVFAVQSLIKDPPFSRLDLLSCRNVLIYMDSQLQRSLLPMFHYTLRDGGVLLLGTSETVGEHGALFEPVDAKWRLFRRASAAPEHTTSYPRTPFFYAVEPAVSAELQKPPTEADIRQLGERLILDSFSPPSVLVNDRLEILFFHGQADRFLAAPTGEPTFHILEMARPGLRHRLGSALHEVLRHRRMVTVEGLRVQHGGGSSLVDVVVKPVVEPSAPPGLAMVVFKDVHQADPLPSKDEGESAGTDPDMDPRIASLEQELQSTKEYLQTTIEELETSNEELKSTNEELQSTNEELQSTNEELGTSKEELQSTNEELETVNAELQSKVDQLSTANNDLNNLLCSTDIGTLFLDTRLRVKRFTPAAAEVFNLIRSDVGRPISDITTKLQLDDLCKDAADVLSTLRQKEAELQTDDGRWYSERILPYRTTDNVIDGVVVTFIDITRLKTAERAAQEARDKHRALLAHARDGVVLLDAETGRIAECNAVFQAQTGLALEELQERTIWELRPPDLREAAREAFQASRRDGRGHSMVLPFQRPDGARVPIEFMSQTVTIGGRPYVQTITRLLPEAAGADAHRPEEAP